jgi:hypothetical protein
MGEHLLRTPQHDDQFQCCKWSKYIQTHTNKLYSFLPNTAEKSSFIHLCPTLPHTQAPGRPGYEAIHAPDSHESTHANYKHLLNVYMN